MRKSARTQIPPFFDNDPLRLHHTFTCNCNVFQVINDVTPSNAIMTSFSSDVSYHTFQL